MRKKGSCFGVILVFFGISLGGILGIWGGMEILRHTNPKGVEKIEAEFAKQLESLGVK